MAGRMVDAPGRLIAVMHSPASAPDPDWLAGLDGQGTIALLGVESDAGARPEDGRLDAVHMPWNELRDRAGLANARFVVLLAPQAAIAPLGFARLEHAFSADSELVAVAPLSGAGVHAAPLPADSAHDQRASDPLDAQVFCASRRLVIETREPVGPCLCLQVDALPHGDSFGCTLADLLAALRDGGARIGLCDHVFVGHPALPVARAAQDDPHALARGDALDELRVALRDAHSRIAGYPGADRKPVVLHVTHSWGGGIARFVHDFIAADAARHHLQLRSEGQWKRCEHGQSLALYYGNERDPLRRWVLDAPNGDIETNSLDYDNVLDSVLSDYGVDAVLVSSLIGHTITALETGRPTVFVFHDMVMFAARLTPGQDPLAGHVHRLDANPYASVFADLGPQRWARRMQRFVAAVETRQVALIAPSGAAARLVGELSDGRLPPATVIEHGLEPVGESAADDAELQRVSRTGKPLLLVPGRMSPEKGRLLIVRNLDALLGAWDIVLLGAGVGGDQVPMCTGLTMIENYEPAQLASYVNALQPSLAWIPSQIAETFSYIALELQELAIPLVATAIGALGERIERGGGALLPDDEREAIAELVALAADPGRLAAARTRSVGERDAEAMVADYAALLGPVEVSELRYRPRMPDAEQSFWNAVTERRARAFEHLEIHASVVERELENTRGHFRRATDQLQRERDEHQGHLNAINQDRQIEHAHFVQERARVMADQERLLDRLKAHDELVERHGRLLEQLRAHDALVERHDKLLGRHNQLLERHEQLDATLREVSAVRDKLVDYSETLKDQLRDTRERLETSERSRLALESEHSLTQQRLNLIENSRSWRITRPLRSATEYARRIRSRLRPGAVQPESGEPAQPVATPIRLDTSEKPRISLIVLASRSRVPVRSSLNALASHRPEVAHEVLVAGADAEALNDVEGVRAIDAAAGAEVPRLLAAAVADARAEKLIFIDAGCVPGAGAVDLLYAAAVADSTAIVGGSLADVHGQLVAAGLRVLENGGVKPRGAGERADAARFGFFTEVDALGPGAIAMTRATFEALGGVSAAADSFESAAYELSVSARLAGRRVFVQPRALFQSSTAGSALERLRSARAASESSNIDWPSRRERPTLVLIDAIMPTPDQDSGSLRIVRLMQAVQSLGMHVVFFPANGSCHGDYGDQLRDLGIEVYCNWQPRAEAWFRNHGAGVAAVLVSRHHIAGRYADLIRRHAPQARFIFDTVDLHYLREQREAELRNDDQRRADAARTRQQEIGVMKSADVTLVVSPVERELLLRENPGLVVEVVSNIHEPEPESSRADFGQRSGVLFVGGFRHPPNVDAAQWLVWDIWPRVRRQLPDAELMLVGSNITEEVRALSGDGVTVMGFVPDLDALLRRVRLTVAPLRFGAGVKGKINSSMSFGVPAVATAVAVEGMGLVDGEDVLVADDAVTFADQIVRAYTDSALWRRLAAGGVRNIEENFSTARARETLARILDRPAD